METRAINHKQDRLQTLAEEVLLLILQWVDAKNLLQLMQVSHFFYKFAADETLWKQQCIKSGYSLPEKTDSKLSYMSFFKEQSYVIYWMVVEHQEVALEPETKTFPGSQYTKNQLQDIARTSENALLFQNFDNGYNYFQRLSREEQQKYFFIVVKCPKKQALQPIKELSAYSPTKETLLKVEVKSTHDFYSRKPANRYPK